MVGEALAKENVTVSSDLWEEYSPGTQLNPLYHTGGCSLAIKGGRGEARSGETEQGLSLSPELSLSLRGLTR